jgi:hypothetical protein
MNERQVGFSQRQSIGHGFQLWLNQAIWYSDLDVCRHELLLTS